MMVLFLKTVFCSAILLGTYFLLLEKEKMHRFNRFFLLFGIVFSLLVPFITITIETAAPAAPVSETIALISGKVQDTIMQPSYIPVKEKNIFPLLLLTGYLLITGILLYRFLRNLFIIRSAVRRNIAIAYPPAKLVLMKESSVASSFLHYIFIPAKEYASGSLEKEILCHELAHVKQKHSIDILFIEFLLVFLWINPFFFLYKKAIRLNHEFLADQKVVTTFRDTRFYQLLLLNKATRGKNLLLSSPLNYLATKKRLVMITKTTSFKVSFIKKLVLVPVMALIILAFGLNKKTIAQQVIPDSSKTAGKKASPENIKRDPWVGISIGSSSEGASQELLDEYQGIVDKYLDTVQSIPDLYKNISPADRDRLEAIFRQMSVEQQSKQTVLFIKSPKPFSRITPTKNQLESFKNASNYGVWVDGKKISNTALNKYSNTDFSHVFISKLYGAAKRNVSYAYQVDLMTNEYYKDYYKKAIANNKPVIAIRWDKADKKPGE